MTATGRDVERFRVAIAHRLGLQFDDARLGFLGEVLQRRLAAGTGTSADAYLRDLERGPAKTEAAALALELTVGETYFFRNSEQFRALAEIILPERMQARANAKTLRLLSAGCASGEEAYSIAILLREAIPDPGWDFAIRAVDINPVALARAARARYSSWALRETPPDIQRRWFRPDGRDLILDEAVRRAFASKNATSPAKIEALWRKQSLDVVFCRNVIMYFAPEQTRALLERIARALHPGGYLFLGHAETLRGLSDEFHLRHTHGTFYYRAQGTFRAHRCGASTSGNGIDADRRLHAEHRRCLGRRDRGRQRARGGARCRRRGQRRRPSPACRRAGISRRFSTCCAPSVSPRRCAHVGELPTASAATPMSCCSRRCCSRMAGSSPPPKKPVARLLAIDELNAGAHYVLALCRETAGDRRGRGRA